MGLVDLENQNNFAFFEKISNEQIIGHDFPAEEQLDIFFSLVEVSLFFDELKGLSLEFPHGFLQVRLNFLVCVEVPESDFQRSIVLHVFELHGSLLVACGVVDNENGQVVFIALKVDCELNRFSNQFDFQSAQLVECHLL